MKTNLLMNFSKDFFTHFFQNSSLNQIDGDNFAVEFSHGAQDYGGNKFVVIVTKDYVWFLNDGDAISKDDVITKVFGQKEGKFSELVTSMFGSGSTKLTIARLGALVELYTMSPNNCKMYSLKYPEYFPIDNLYDTHWNLLNGHGEDVIVNESDLSLEEYDNEFSEIQQYLTFTPTVGFKIKKYVYQSHMITPVWGKLKHILNMTFVDKSKFDFDLIDTTKTKPYVGSGSQLFFPTLPSKKGTYASNLNHLDQICDKDGNPIYFIYESKDVNGNIVKTSKFKVCQYKYLTEDWNMIAAKKFASTVEDNIFHPWKVSSSTTYAHFFDHTGKWIFSDNHDKMGLQSVKYNFSNMVFILVEGELPYNVVKTDGAGKIFRQDAADFHKKYIDANTSKQHNGLGKVENSKVEEIYDIQVGNIIDKSTKLSITNSLSYVIGMSGITSITMKDLHDTNNHQLTSVTEQGELDWYIGKDKKKTILIEALNTNLDYIHTRQFNWQIDSFSDEVEIGVLLIEGNPKSSNNQKKIKSLKTILDKKKELYSLKEVYIVSFEDLINNNVDNFYTMGLSM